MDRSFEKIKNDNNGISLIEIIIVIAIMVVLGGMLFLSTSVATDKHVNSCANKITSSLEQTRGLALGKQNGYIEIWQEADGSVKCQMYVNNAPYSDEYTIGHAGLNVTVNTYSSSYSLLGHGTTTIHFSRSNGSVTDTDFVKSIVVDNGRRSITISLDHFTGKVMQGPIVTL